MHRGWWLFSQVIFFSPGFSSLKSIALNHLSFQTLFNPNKTVVKMFVVIYDLREMPANHQTFLRQRTFSVPVRREVKRTVSKENSQQTEERLLRYLIHLRWAAGSSQEKVERRNPSTCQSTSHCLCQQPVCLQAYLRKKERCWFGISNRQ